jgi:hypothetical protein
MDFRARRLKSDTTPGLAVIPIARSISLLDSPDEVTSR